MTSKPVSLNDDSLEGSWVDIRGVPSQCNASSESLGDYRSSPYSMVESTQNLGMLSYQVQRFLQDSQRTIAHIPSSRSQQNLTQSNGNNIQSNEDIQSLVYLSDTDNGSLDGYESRVMMNNLRDLTINTSINESNIHHRTNTTTTTAINETNESSTAIRTTTTNADDNLDLHMANKQQQQPPPPTQTTSGDQQQHHYHNQQQIFHNQNSCRYSCSKGNMDFIPDQLSDTLSLLSRASAGGLANDSSFQDLDWMWDWTAQPEYFSGQEWKVYAPKQEYLMRQRQLYKNSGNHNDMTDDVASLLVLTNVLSVIIGAGLTYGILARKNGV